MFENKKVIIFDMDGTLLDSVGLWNDTDRYLIETYGQKPAPALEVIGAERDKVTCRFRDADNPYLAYCEYLRRQYGCSISAEEIHAVRYRYAREALIHTVDYKPQADRFIRLLKKAGLTLAIASATKKANLEIYKKLNRNLLLKAPLETYFSLIYGREDALRMKPDPYIYHRVMRELKVTSEDCLVFEDSLAGVTAAKAAGIETAVIYDRYADSDREAINGLADFFFPDFSAAIACWEKETGCL